MSKRPTRLLPHATVVRINLKLLEQEATTLKKIWCFKMMDVAHIPEIISEKLNVMEISFKARYRLSDLLRAQQNDMVTSILLRCMENGAPDKSYLEEDSYKSLKQFHMRRKDSLD